MLKTQCMGFTVIPFSRWEIYTEVGNQNWGTGLGPGGLCGVFMCPMWRERYMARASRSIRCVRSQQPEQPALYPASRCLAISASYSLFYLSSSIGGVCVCVLGCRSGRNLAPPRSTSALPSPGLKVLGRQACQLQAWALTSEPSLQHRLPD